MFEDKYSYETGKLPNGKYLIPKAQVDVYSWHKKMGVKPIACVSVTPYPSLESVGCRYIFEIKYYIVCKPEATILKSKDNILLVSSSRSNNNRRASTVEQNTHTIPTPPVGAVIARIIHVTETEQQHFLVNLSLLFPTCLPSVEIVVKPSS